MNATFRKQKEIEYWLHNLVLAIYSQVDKMPEMLEIPMQGGSSPSPLAFEKQRLLYFSPPPFFF